VVPMALMVGSALIASLLAAEGELTGMRACGVPAIRAMVPVLAISLAVTPLYFLLRNAVVPRTNAIASPLKQTQIKAEGYEQVAGDVAPRGLAGGGGGALRPRERRRRGSDHLRPRHGRAAGFARRRARGPSRGRRDLAPARSVAHRTLARAHRARPGALVCGARQRALARARPDAPLGRRARAGDRGGKGPGAPHTAAAHQRRR